MSNSQTTAKRFVQAVHTLTIGDAISGEVLALDRCFLENKQDSQIISLFSSHLLDEKRKDARNFVLNPETDELILHYSIGSPLNDIFRNFTGKKALIYHNLTPARWFHNVNPRLEQELVHGLAELPELCRLSDRLIADSIFNAQELKNLGFDAQVLELCIDPNRWNIHPSSGVRSLLRNTGEVNLLHVGRLAPNKCIEDIIRIFYFYHNQIREKSRLWLVGTDIDTELYSYSLRRLCEELRLDEHVMFTGAIADEEVLAMYENSDAYICMSEHEGFCVPAVEALHYKIPVIAYKSSAVPYTLGDAGILVAEKRHNEIAELIEHIITNQHFKSELIQKGLDRMPHFSFERFCQDVQVVFGFAR